MPKMHQNTFGGRALPGPAGGAEALPQIPSHNEGPTSKGKRGRKAGEGRTRKGREGKGERGEGEGKERKGLPQF